MTRGKARRQTTRGSGGTKVSTARAVALEVLELVASGLYAENALSQVLSACEASQRDRALATELVYGVLRWRRRIDAALSRHLRYPKERLDPRIHHILQLALYQILFLGRIPQHAVVNEAVTQARMHGGGRSAGFVNGILRNALRHLDILDPPPAQDAASLARYYSHPTWLVRRWLDAYGNDTTLRILAQNNDRAPLDLRVNTLRTSTTELKSMFEREEIATEGVTALPNALRIRTGGRPVETLPGFAEGLFAVQGIASQLIAPLLCALPHERILDTCAAPGGKTAHLAALTENNAEIVGMDTNEARLEAMRANLARLGIKNICLRVADARSPQGVTGLGEFDRILVDPACTALGVLRHNPEAKYRLRPNDPAAFARDQLAILVNVSNLLKRGGLLVYSVCTTSSEETTEVVDRFLSLRQDFREDPFHTDEVPFSWAITPRGHLFTFPSPLGEALDGFFAARFHRE